MSSDGDSGERKNNAGSKSDTQVHSANSWETADLGDEQRNEKFLRLMGASKKDHRGKIVIGDQKTIHKRESKEEKHLAEELEEQYEHSMEHRLVGGRRGHLGLGFHPETAEVTEQEDKPELVEEVGVEAKEEESGEDSAPEDLPSEADTEEREEGTYDEENTSRPDKQKGALKVGQRKRDSLDRSPESDVKKMKLVKSVP